MEIKKVERIGYWTFVKLNTIAGAGFGLILSIITFINVAFRGNMTYGPDALNITDATLGLILGPTSFAIIFALLSMIFLYPGILL